MSVVPVSWEVFILNMMSFRTIYGSTFVHKGISRTTQLNQSTFPECGRTSPRLNKDEKASPVVPFISFSFPTAEPMWPATFQCPCHCHDSHDELYPQTLNPKLFLKMLFDRYLMTSMRKVAQILIDNEQKINNFSVNDNDNDQPFLLAKLINMAKES